MKFILKIKNGFVEVSECVGDEIEILKREGEKRQIFNSEFWEWFRKKIEYENEEVSFLIKSDVKVDIPKFFNISKKNLFSKECLELFEDYRAIPEIKKETKKRIKKITIQKIFKEETKGYRNDEKDM